MSDYKDLPEHEHLINALKSIHEFDRKHEEEIECTGCKVCMDIISGTKMFNHSYKKVIKEHLTEEQREEYEKLIDDLKKTNHNYLGVVAPNLLKNKSK